VFYGQLPDLGVKLFDLALMVAFFLILFAGEDFYKTFLGLLFPLGDRNASRVARAFLRLVGLLWRPWP
jgi:hypothetical protein